MHSTEDILREVRSLPVEERAAIVDCLLRTLNAPEPAVDAEWLAVAKRRLEEVRSGRAQPVPGEDVFARARQRLE